MTLVSGGKGRYAPEPEFKPRWFWAALSNTSILSKHDKRRGLFSENHPRNNPHDPSQITPPMCQNRRVCQRAGALIHACMFSARCVQHGFRRTWLCSADCAAMMSVPDGTADVNNVVLQVGQVRGSRTKRCASVPRAAAIVSSRASLELLPHSMGV